MPTTNQLALPQASARTYLRSRRAQARRKLLAEISRPIRCKKSSTTALFFHDEDLASLRALSVDVPFRDRRLAGRFAAWQATLAQHHRPLSFKNCAVVGSSGSLLVGRPRGDLIDGHDGIFRINYAPTRGYEQYVGRRTSVWVLAWGANTSANERSFRPKKRASAGAATESKNTTSHPPPHPPLATLIHCQPSNGLSGCWRHVGSSAEPFANFTRLSPLAWPVSLVAQSNAGAIPILLLYMC